MCISISTARLYASLRISRAGASKGVPVSLSSSSDIIPANPSHARISSFVGAFPVARFPFFLCAMLSNAPISYKCISFGFSRIFEGLSLVSRGSVGVCSAG